MRTVLLEQTEQPSMQITSGPGAPMFTTNGPHTRIYRAPVRAIGAMSLVDGREIFGQVIDIAPGGCLFRTEATLSVGSTFSVRITILDGSRRAVADVTGTIRRVETSEGRKAYGCEFVADNSSDRKSHQWLYSQAVK